MDNVTRDERFRQRVSRVDVPRRNDLSAFALSRAVTRVGALRGPDKAVLRSLADHYPSIWPSVQKLAEESGFGETATRQALRRLLSAGWIQALSDGRGGRWCTNQYAINVDMIIAGAQNSSPRAPFSPLVPNQYETGTKANPSRDEPKPLASRTERVRLASQKGSSREPEVIIKENSEKEKRKEQDFSLETETFFAKLINQRGMRAALSEDERKQHADRVRQQADAINRARS